MSEAGLMHKRHGILQALNPLRMARNLFARRDLIRQFTQREIQSRYRGTLLGFAWAMLQPLIMLAVYIVVFGYIMTGDEKTAAHTGLEFALMLFCGLTVFNIFADCVGRSTGCVLANPNFVKKVVFPLEILPVAILGASIIPAVISLLLIILGSTIIYHHVAWAQLLAPLMLIPILFFTLGVSWFLAALGVFFRDVGQIIGLVLQALSFLSAIFFQISDVTSPPLKTMLYFNPIAVVAESLKAVMLNTTPLPVIPLLLTTAGSILIMILGYAFFYKCKRAFADVI